MPERTPQPDNARDASRSAHLAARCSNCCPRPIRRPRPDRRLSLSRLCQLDRVLQTAGRSTLLILLLVNLTGCAYDPRRMRLPELWPRHPELERRAAEYHDPFPDASVGPDADSRPRGFNRQRSETRRAADLRSVHILDGADRLPPTSSKPDRRFSQVVKP
ncbi:hypothetical protein GC176_25255 [bacterium]|nr:hypothetical protein [bacterium]